MRAKRKRNEFLTDAVNSLGRALSLLEEGTNIPQRSRGFRLFSVRDPRRRDARFSTIPLCTRRGTVVLPLWRARRVSNPSGISLEKCLFPWNRPASFSREYALSFFFLLRAEEAQRWSLSLSLFLSLSPLLCFLSSAGGKTFTGTPPGKKTLPFIRFQRPVIFVRAELYDAPKLFLFFSFGYGSGLSVAISPAGRSKSQMDRCVRLMHVLPQVSSRRVHFKWRRGILQWRTFESHDNLTFNWI